MCLCSSRADNPRTGPPPVLNRSLTERTTSRARIANETEEERAARLQQQRQFQETRIANETEEQRAARLVQLRLSQENRIANETEEQRAARLQRDYDQELI